MELPLSEFGQHREAELTKLLHKSGDSSALSLTLSKTGTCLAEMSEAFGK